MNEPMEKTSPSNLNLSLQEIKIKTADEIKKNGFSQAAALLLALAELVKEQTQNENASHTTR
jgi:hypothetical protein